MKHFSSFLMLTSVFLSGYNAFEIEDHLQKIHDLTTNSAILNCQQQDYTVIPVPLTTSKYKSWQEKAKMAANLIEETQSIRHRKLIESSIRHLLGKNSIIQEARVVSLDPFWCISGKNNNQKFSNTTLAIQAPWMLSSHGFERNVEKNFIKNKQLQQEGGQWTYPYFSCDKKAWILSFVQTILKTNGRLGGFLSFDIDITFEDINQCDKTSGQIKVFLHTHKCHQESSECIFQQGHGWVKGGYSCHCKKGFYSRTEKAQFNGSLVEVAFMDKVVRKDETYDDLYQCLKCQPGCETCVDNSPCLASYNWIFRNTLLIFSLVCTMATFVLIFLVYKYRKLKVFRLGSPAFLCITLIGCATMYLEMLAIFPHLDLFSCIATKWTRHMGFLLTYSSLLLKTWRVNLTFRVKSAHKLKLTDKQLLQWLFPILLVMVIYLSAWTLSDPPQAIYIEDISGLKFKQCSYGWWDHSMALGELLFLIWGIKVCFSVRKARTHYNEAKLITWSIYNIAVVNIIMAAIHLFLFPQAGPDMKYFLGFLRTQLSTTVTIILVFGPKFLRLARGTANELDDRIRARGSAASMIEVPLEREASQKDVYVENEELKEEIQKLAGQIEYLKIVGMLVENPHIKPKKDGYFTKENCSKHFNHNCNLNGTWVPTTTNTSTNLLLRNKSCKSPPLPTESKNGNPVILSENCEEKTCKIVDPNKTKSTKQDLLSVQNQTKPIPDQNQPQPRESTSTISGDPSSITGEEVSRLTSNFRAISCETNSYRDVSPSVEPFIPERV